jgi:pimeloyl-ACP methyl ester carboxylesterase
MSSPIRYARSGDVNIAYQVTGDGPFDLVLVPGSSRTSRSTGSTRVRRFLERLGSFARLIRFDKRGTGLSDRGVGLPDLETRMDDVRAVMDAAGSEPRRRCSATRRAARWPSSSPRPTRRTRSLVLYGTYAKRREPDEDYPWAADGGRASAIAAGARATWGENVDLSTMAPTPTPRWRLVPRRGRAG